MTRKMENSRRTSALSEIRDLTAAKAEAEAQIADCLRHSAFEERMLRSVLNERQTAANNLSKKACRAGIKAWKLSIKAFQNDIGRYEVRINAILERFPGLKSEIASPLVARNLKKKRR